MKRLVTNTTVKNKSKLKRLNSEHHIPTQNVCRKDVCDFLESLLKINNPKEQILFSIGLVLLNGNKNKSVKSFLSEYCYEPLKMTGVPLDEFDLLGSAYQFLNSKTENLEKGSFYTGRTIATDFVSDLKFDEGQVIFDPACGSGSFLFNSAASAKQIYGVDFDPVAIMIAKFNYFIKFPDAGSPNLFHVDFFEWFSKNERLKFDYVVGNPPYGANLDLTNIASKNISSGESFSYFIEYGYRLLKKDGVFRFLLPEAILNVRKHTDVRQFILNESNLTKIKKYSKKFAGVMSDVFMIELDNKKNKTVSFVSEETISVPKSIYKNIKNNVFVQLSEKDASIIEKVNALKKYDLSESVFGLGIVTGDNKTRLFKSNIHGSERVYSGKEVEKYKLSPAKNWLVFDRNRLQQVAPDEIYRAKEKLVYKTINKFLKVAIDTTGSLTTNSANIIIPKIKGLRIYTILALLNSNIYSFLHLKLFGGVNKIAKENLMALPFPKMSEADDKKIEKMTKEAMKSGNDKSLQEYVNKNIFHLSESEIYYVNRVVKK